MQANNDIFTRTLILQFSIIFHILFKVHAGVAQLLERFLAKEEVES